MTDAEIIAAYPTIMVPMPPILEKTETQRSDVTTIPTTFKYPAATLLRDSTAPFLPGAPNPSFKIDTSSCLFSSSSYSLSLSTSTLPSPSLSGNISSSSSSVFLAKQA